MKTFSKFNVFRASREKINPWGNYYENNRIAGSNYARGR